jgi:hypothetical protein
MSDMSQLGQQLKPFLTFLDTLLGSRPPPSWNMDIPPRGFIILGERAHAFVLFS